MSYTVEHYDGRAGWLKGRKNGLGASDAAIVLGMSRWRSAYSLATDKLTEGIDEEMDETAEWGLRLEEPIAQKFVEVTGIELWPVPPYTILRSVERPHICCTPDRLTEDGVLEIKTAHFESGKEWAERIPLAYQCQLQHTLYVTGRERGWFAVLIDGYRWKYHPMRRHEKFLAKMLPKLDAFWEAIQLGEYPKVDASESTARALAARYGSPTDGQIELETDYQELADEYDAILERGCSDDKRKLEIQNLVKERLAEFQVGILPDQSGFGWQMNGKGSRRFSRIKKVRFVDGV